MIPVGKDKKDTALRDFDTKPSIEIDKPKRNAALRSLGVMPKGKTGCDTCNSQGFIVCQCPPRAATNSGGGSSEGGDNKLPTSTAQSALATNDVDLELRYFSLSPKPSLADRKALRDIYDEALLFNQQCVMPQDKLMVYFENDVLVVKAPNPKAHDDFLSQLSRQGMWVGEPVEAAKSFNPSPFKLELKPEVY